MRLLFFAVLVGFALALLASMGAHRDWAVATVALLAVVLGGACVYEDVKKDFPRGD